MEDNFDITLATNEELKREASRLSFEFEECKRVIQEKYNSMLEYQRQYQNVVSMLEKRGEKPYGQL